MFDATLPSEAPAGAAATPPGRVTVRGAARLSWKAQGGATHLDDLYNTDPLRFLFPRTARGEPETAVLVTTSGGLVGGDRLDISVTAGAGSRGLAMTQAAEKVYGSAGPTTEITAAFTADENAWLEWLPHETILFDGARLTRRTRLNLAPGAQAIAGEILVFGRVACGETIRAGAVRETWEVRRDDRLVWADTFHVNGDWPAVMEARAGLDGKRAMATVVCAGEDPDAIRAAAQAALGDHETPALRAGATVISDLVIVRILADQPEDLRAALTDVWGALRTSMSDFSRALPRLWHM